MSRPERNRRNIPGSRQPKADIQALVITALKFNPAGKNVDFQNADFFRLEFQGCNFHGADLRGADFLETDIEGADISGVDFTDSINLTREQVLSARFDPKNPPVGLPQDWGTCPMDGRDSSGEDHNMTHQEKLDDIKTKGMFKSQFNAVDLLEEVVAEHPLLLEAVKATRSYNSAGCHDDSSFDAMSEAVEKALNAVEGGS